MSKIRTAFHLLKTPGDMILPLAEMGLLNWMKDEVYLKCVYKCLFGKKLDLKNPQTFCEKIQWLKIHDRKDKYISLVDKILVKDIVGKEIGYDYIIPTLGIWDSFDDICFDKLPQQFVLKCNHDSGSIVICHNKSTFDYNMARRKLKYKINKNSFYWGREWPYKNVKRKIMAEPYLQDENNKTDLIDYKFYCFNGIPTYCQVITQRSVDEKIDFFDMDWVHQPFVGLKQNVCNSSVHIKKPLNFDKMVLFANKLSKDMFFSRVDFYEVNNRLFFGEITLFPASGFGKFTPEEWNIRLGQMIQLPIDSSK